MIFDDEQEVQEVTEEMVNKALAWMSRNAEKVAGAIANRQHVEAFIKVVEAEQRQNWNGEAAHVQERNARASQAYKDVLEAYRDASKLEQTARYRWQLAETAIDIWRTRSANVRKI